jgi:hypothetical protein
MTVGNYHAIQLSTKGILGTTVGLSTKGYIVTIEEFIYIPPEPEPEVPTGGHGGSSWRRSDHRKRKQEDQKIVKITVHLSGETYEHYEYVNRDITITASDVQVEVDENKEVWISIGDVDFGNKKEN